MSSFSKWLAFLCLTSMLASVSCPSPIVAQFAPEGVQIQGGDEAQRAAIEKAMKEQAAKQGKPGGPPKGKDDKKRATKKDDPLDEAITINFRPTLKRVEDFFFNAFEEMVRSTQVITNLESDLVPFVSMPQEPCFDVSLDFPWFQEAAASVKNMFDESIEGPR